MSRCSNCYQIEKFQLFELLCLTLPIFFSPAQQQKPTAKNQKPTNEICIDIISPTSQELVSSHQPLRAKEKQFFCLSAKAIIFVRKKKKNPLLSLFTVTLTVEWSTSQKFLSFFEITFALIFWIVRKITFQVMVKMRSESISFVIFNLILHRNTFNSIVFPEHGMEESPWFFLFSKVIFLFPTWQIGSGASYSNDWL